MTLRLNTAKQIECAAAGVNELTVLEVYQNAGGQPASANDAPPGTLLVTITGIAWTVTGNPAVLSGTPNATAAATGTAHWGRFRNAAGTKRVDGAVGQEFTLSDVNIVQNGVVTLTSASLTQASGE